MENMTLYGIHLSDLQLFLNVAKYKNFTKAGEVMYMTQSGVSKRINQIEKDLGLILFTRNKREVALTPAGKILEERLNLVLTDILDAIATAHIVQTGTSDVLRVSYLEWDNMSFIEKLRGFMNMNPQFDIRITGHQFKDLHDALENDKVDIIFTTSYDCSYFNTEDYNIFRVLSTPLMAYINDSHPLAERESVSITDLAEVPVLMLNRNSSLGYTSYIKDMFERYDIRPLIGSYANTGMEHIGNILLGKGILFASGFFIKAEQRDGLAKIKIKNEELSICAISKKNNKSLVLAEFIKYILSTDAQWLTVQSESQPNKDS